MKFILIKFINFYQRFLSPLKRPSCVFYPTCSEYSKQAIEKYGVFKGFKLSFLRIIRCHPWQKNNINPLE